MGHRKKMKPGLTLDQASNICMNECMALCCQGPLILSIEEHEIDLFKNKAQAIGTTVYVHKATNKGGWVRFSDYPEDHCPMLNPKTFACNIYDSRPQRCRDFPTKPTHWCAISENDTTNDNSKANELSSPLIGPKSDSRTK